ncbi:hypothetical protein UA08_00084 [Talaromyces atroroseus]|uniref:DUF7492 domain-containing protein n=1 Tax=Talaromyces atroroseus TaxID=1441469 RepID=A0A225BB37_TALAT|nr:hypothetical protein UA08_00084 [Talaromyces atroroseus]OKL64125.1 hypothetical protein UA08_00084 [Talaromyces atroroseus]
MLDIMQTLIVLATTLAPLAHAHSWVEELTLLAPDGTFTGPRGYPRGTVQRSAAFQDDMMEWQLPTDNGDQITPDMAMCRPSQQTANYTAGSPILQAPAGASIALRYQENGHVTQPWIPSGKPEGSGAVYVYGTTKPSEDDTLAGIYQTWTLDGTGGDARGRLLTSQFFDDGQCYQVSNAPKSVQRQQEFPRKAEAGSVEGANLWCQTDVKLPNDLAAGTEYTLYWVWDWSTMDTTDSKAQPQFYTSCMDVSITDSNSNGAGASNQEASASFAHVSNYGDAAVSSIFESLLTATVTVPATLTPGYFTSGQTNIPPPATTMPTRVTTSPGSSVTTSPVGQMGAAPAVQQPTAACNPTLTITATATCPDASTVTTTITSVVTQPATATLPPNQNARLARRRPLAFADA